MVDKNDRFGDWEEREKTDRNRDGIEDEIQPPVPDIEAGSRQLSEKLREHPNTDPGLSGGDVDARWEMAESAGDETPGTTPTPDESDIEAGGRAMGVSYQDNEPLKFGEKERKRDQQRWELDPASSEDYPERAREQGKPERRKTPRDD